MAYRLTKLDSMASLFFSSKKVTRTSHLCGGRDGGFKDSLNRLDVLLAEVLSIHLEDLVDKFTHTFTEHFLSVARDRPESDRPPCC